MIRIAKILLLIGAGIVVILALFIARPCPSCEKEIDVSDISAVEIRNTTFQVDVADTDAERIKGLSGKESLSERTGMLFIFEESAPRSFWMKDMRFSIDIVWIDKNRKIVGIHRHVSPETYPQSFVSPEPVMYVLEVAEGVSSFMNIGDTVNFIKSSQ
ncbi:MAG: hypothetical protein COV34_02615 [Candidatus Zambryskibacteria bacterium CG10_big_fil_rev_8_21_14_0_10_42_12]|uniref:DUF192 domain-containing protein n=1 Tax=Candidatus Zambryskibacteria bacterium CG10_big_fil_rev_8_21_14_0_10_42_12 TaxID=1975115 RepID=A0A2H0QUK1_9BACT|nr:MAG: hypothetical protein COV34_02615 [Candidatus Zambryskibacteria bacterium CG10_big_fil_rev_8_21_14_0_10_42_12]